MEGLNDLNHFGYALNGPYGDIHVGYESSDGFFFPFFLSSSLFAPSFAHCFLSLSLSIDYCKPFLATIHKAQCIV